ncbi:MAG TPA: alkaline phosphatase family protein, partial [Gemmatales bacterium]|nr:alkaline phosphatase family protein [Gemmatales bacterium]
MPQANCTRTGLSPRLLLLASCLVLAGSASLVVGSARLQAGPRPESVANRPKLAVLVVFDQLRGDYPARWRSLFGEGGFERLLTEGAWFAECHYPYASTVTGAGHASMGTGVTPRVHGVIGNDWFDRAQGSKVYCATLGDRYQRVPSRAAGSGGRGGSPERLLVPALGDGIKQRDPPGKVVAMSLKDRGGVLIAGHRADAVYWFDDADGQFVTSTFYRAAPHDWAKAFNDRRVPDRWFGTQWERLRPDVDYTAHAGPDVGPGEGSGVEQGVAFPHSMSGGMTEPGPRSYQALYNSPFGNDLLWEFAKVAAQRGERARAETWRLHVSELKAALEREGWDGEWYRRAYFDDGTPLGSAADPECRID